MDVIGTIETQDTPIDVQTLRLSREGNVKRIFDALQEESLLKVYVNDILTMQLGCSANHLVELVVGRLFTEGMIRSEDEIDCISICENSMRAEVYLEDRTADLSNHDIETTPTCCTNNKTLNNYFGTGEPLAPVTPIAWSPEWIFKLTDAFTNDKTVHARTNGTHSAYLSTPEKILCFREDIGRHNAFDKVIGWALNNDVDLSQCAIFTSGRVPTDMVTKAIRAHVPILVTKAVATDKTVQIARKFDLTLICAAHSDSIDVMNDPMGIVKDPSRQTPTRTNKHMAEQHA